MPAGPSRWILSPPDPMRASELAQALGVSSLTGQLLLNRGIADAERGRRYLEPKLSELRRPDGDAAMAGFATAVERLARALAANEAVGVFGDYDVDGVTSCALLTCFLCDAGGRVVPRVARRDAGYGFGLDDVRAFADAGCAVIVTCDLGTSDHESIADARARGIDVIVVDHHQVPDREPEALALINPHQPSCRFPFKGLASVGVAFYLACALRTRLKAEQRDAPDPRQLLDLVAVGTVADMAPLTDENRILVHHGMQRLMTQPRPGLRELARVAALDEGVRRTADIALRLAPRLNAPGRLGAAQLALDLLLARDDASATELAIECEQANQKRQKVQERVFEEALQQAEAHARNHHEVLLVAGDDWHPGVVGIVAAKLVERFARPAAVVALDGNLGRGSLRSAYGFDLHAALKASSDLLVRYGGHAQAAGLTVEKTRLGELRERLSQAARRHLGEAQPMRELKLDAEVELSAIDEPFAWELRRLEPYGVGNPEPLLGARGLVLERARAVGTPKENGRPGHLQVTLRSGEHARDGIGFNLAEDAPDAGSRVRAAFFPELDSFRGLKRVRVRLREILPDDA